MGNSWRSKYTSPYSSNKEGISPNYYDSRKMINLRDNFCRDCHLYIQTQFLNTNIFQSSYKKSIIKMLLQCLFNHCRHESFDEVFLTFVLHRPYLEAVLVVNGDEVLSKWK